MFYELMRRHGPFCFYAFDLLWLDGTDLRGLALSGRKALLRKLLPRKAHAVRYVEHVANGTDLFRVICDWDMEGIVAKQASARYHAGGDNLGQDQELRVQPGGRDRCRGPRSVAGQTRQRHPDAQGGKNAYRTEARERRGHSEMHERE